MDIEMALVVVIESVQEGQEEFDYTRLPKCEVNFAQAFLRRDQLFNPRSRDGGRTLKLSR